jgi:branched-chain amino acid transport system ATP-binding protein
MLTIEGVTAHYGQLIALDEMSLELGAGQTLAVVGANGAGKSTLLSLISGEKRPTRGRVFFEEHDITNERTSQRVRRGISLVPEGRQLFGSLTVEDNLLTGAAAKRKGEWDLNAVYELFPLIRDKRSRQAESLSGGEQQAVAIGRALMANPSLLLLDEVSLGLAPVIIQDLYVRLHRIAAEGTTLLLVEQNISEAFSLASQIVCLLEGRVILRGAPSDIDMGTLRDAYFGSGHSGSEQKGETK